MATPLSPWRSAWHAPVSPFFLEAVTRRKRPACQAVLEIVAQVRHWLIARLSAHSYFSVLRQRCSCLLRVPISMENRRKHAQFPRPCYALMASGAPPRQHSLREATPQTKNSCDAGRGVRILRLVS